MAPPDELELQGLFKPDVNVAALTGELLSAGAPEDSIHVLSPLPLSEQTSGRICGMPLYGLTFAAGLIGIGVGLFFAGGTAAMYPLMTGGKPIVAPPIVGIVSYETMMLVAIVTTFLAMLVKVRSTNAGIHSRDARIDDGRIAVIVRVPMFGATAGAVQDILERRGAIDVRLSVIPPDEEEPRPTAQHAASVLLALLLTGGPAACSRDMQEQTSYQTQEAPRLHSPQGSVPRSSRKVLSAGPMSGSEAADRNASLFRINCLHCHGADGDGNGPVAPFLKQPPANLKNVEIRGMSDLDIYGVLTRGKDMMPSFAGELSAEERWQLARFVWSLSHPATARAVPAEPR